jgi:hypothetical protein
MALFVCLWALWLCLPLGTPSLVRAQTAEEVVLPLPPDWRAPNGVIDLKLRDPALVGALDLHIHMDPDLAGEGDRDRQVDVLGAARIARERGMRGFAMKSRDITSAAASYLARRQVPGVEVFGRFAMNLASGGFNPAAVMQFVSISGGWGRIVEFPTRDRAWPERPRPQEQEPWASLFPNLPGSSERSYVESVRDGQLVPEARAILTLISRVKSAGSNGTIAVATGHATPEEHVIIAREARRLNIPVLITHPRDTMSDAQLLELKAMGAYIEMVGPIYADWGASPRERVALALNHIRLLGAESIIASSDCGGEREPIFADCLALDARALRANGVTDRQIDIMFKENPARYLGLPAAGSPGLIPPLDRPVP